MKLTQLPIILLSLAFSVSGMPAADEKKAPAKSGESDTNGAKVAQAEAAWPLVFKSDDGKTTLELRGVHYGTKEALRTERNQFTGQATSALPIRVHPERESRSDALLVTLTFTEGSSVFVNLEAGKRCSLTTAKGKKHPVRGLGVIDETKEVNDFSAADANAGQVGWMLGGKGTVVALAFDIPAELTELRLTGLSGFSKINFTVPGVSKAP